MEKRRLGSTGIEVTDIGMGCWAIGGASFRGGVASGWSGASIDASLAAVKAAWEAGVTFYDTADAYGRGKSEVLVGYALQDVRDEAVIATKAGNSLAGPGQHFDEPYLRGALDASLTRLEVEAVEVFLLHGPPVEEMTDELFALMGDLKASGKVRSWGVSIGSAAEGRRALEGGAEVIQLVYNILQQDVARQILPLAQEREVGIIARVPLASGWLTGKYDENTRFPAVIVQRAGGDDFGTKAYEGEDVLIRVRLYGDKEYNQSRLRRTAEIMRGILNRSNLTLTNGFHAFRVIANSPELISDEDGFPGYMIDVRVLLLAQREETTS